MPNTQFGTVWHSLLQRAVLVMGGATISTVFNDIRFTR
jgi:hypothetical protein